MNQSFLQHLKIKELEDRLELIEKQVFKKKELKLTKSQKLLVLYELGIINKLFERGLTNTQIGTLLHFICDIDSENTRKDLSTINKSDSDIKTETNYKAALRLFQECGLKDIVDKMEKLI